MGKEKNLIEEMEEIYHEWDFGSKEKAKKMLQRMHFSKSNNYKNIEEERLVLHNLTTIIMQIENSKDKTDRDMTQAKYYSKVLLDLLDSYPNYKKSQINKERYCRALNNYITCRQDKLTQEELENAYKFHYETYKHYEYDIKHVMEYREKLISQYNLNMLNVSFNFCLSL
jgi:hypothetical protein